MAAFGDGAGGVAEMFLESRDEGGDGIVAAIQGDGGDALSLFDFVHGVLEAHDLQPAPECLPGLPDEEAGEGFFRHAEMPAPIGYAYRRVGCGQGRRAQLHQAVFGRHEQGPAHFLAGFEAIHKHQREPFPFLRREVRLEVVHRKKKLPQQRGHFQTVALPKAGGILEQGSVEEKRTVP